MIDHAQWVHPWRLLVVWPSVDKFSSQSTTFAFHRGIVPEVGWCFWPHRQQNCSREALFFCSIHTHMLCKIIFRSPNLGIFHKKQISWRVLVVVRSQELRELLLYLGPCYVKLGQALSSRLMQKNHTVDVLSASSKQRCGAIGNPRIPPSGFLAIGNPGNPYETGGGSMIMTTSANHSPGAGKPSRYHQRWLHGVAPRRTTASVCSYHWKHMTLTFGNTCWSWICSFTMWQICWTMLRLNLKLFRHKGTAFLILHAGLF